MRRWIKTVVRLNEGEVVAGATDEGQLHQVTSRLMLSGRVVQ